MNVPTITMDPKLARAKLHEYREAVHAAAHGAAEKEYQAAAKAYAALGRGRKLCNLRDVFRLAPLDEVGRPRLAIARADQRQVWLRWGAHNERAFFRTSEWENGRKARYCNRTIGVPMGKRPIGGHELTGTAMVPLVPPGVKMARNLVNHFTLWEVEQWQLVPPRDPYLLRHLAGDLYIVVGAWDLTEVERAIMGERVH